MNRYPKGRDEDLPYRYRRAKSAEKDRREIHSSDRRIAKPKTISSEADSGVINKGRKVRAGKSPIWFLGQRSENGSPFSKLDDLAAAFFCLTNAFIVTTVRPRRRSHPYLDRRSRRDCLQPTLQMIETL